MGGFKSYRWTEANSYFMLANEDSVAMGGGGEFGLYLDGDLKSGTSGDSETFGNKCLTLTEDFDIAEVELWGFVPKQ